MIRLAVIGSINLDYVLSGAPLPAPGETVTGASFAQYPGGKGANQALAARRLGAEVSLIGCVGQDSQAEAALSLLKQDGVNLSGVETVPNAATGIAAVIVSPEGENQITVASGANSCLTPDMLPDLSGFDGILCQLEVPVDTVAHASTQSVGMFAVNLAPAGPVPQEVLAQSDVLMVNETEAAWYGNALSDSGAMIVQTLGAEGAELWRDGERRAQVAAFPVDVVDTTGAGDTFCAALMVALLEGQSPEAALRFASAASALAVTRAGAQPSLPWREEVETLLRT